MTPILIVKTSNGFALVKYQGDVPAVDLSELLCFGDLDDSYSYRHDGLLAAVKEHFKPKPEATTLREVVS